MARQTAHPNWHASNNMFANSSRCSEEPPSSGGAKQPGSRSACTYCGESVWMRVSGLKSARINNDNSRFGMRRCWKQPTNEPCDQLVNDLLIRFCAAFLDQGYANWRLPDRDQGFFRAFANLYGQSFGPPDRWLRGLRRELKRLEEAGIEPLESIDESLRLMGVEDDERDAFLVATLQALPGWAGMIWQMETNAEWTLFPAPRGTLTEYLAVRLILDRLAAAHVARQTIGWRGELRALRDEVRGRIPETETLGAEQHAFLAFQLAQVRGWMPQELYKLPEQQWRMLMAELDAFDDFERRRILHRAYERRYRNQTLDALAIHSHQRTPWAHESSPVRQQAPSWSGFPRLAEASGPARRSRTERPPGHRAFRSSAASTIARSRSGGTWKRSIHVRNVRRGRLLRRGDVLSRGVGCTSPAPLSGDHQAATLRQRRSRLHVCQGTQAACRYPPRTRRRVAPGAPGQPHLRRRCADRLGGHAGVDSDGHADSVSADHRSDSPRRSATS